MMQLMVTLLRLWELQKLFDRCQSGMNAHGKSPGLNVFPMLIVYRAPSRRFFKLS